MKYRTYFLLGSNLGDRKRNLDLAIEKMEEKLGKVTRKSAVYETEPWGKSDQPNFLNQVVLFETEEIPFKILDFILAIEKDLGRVRYEKNAERIIDIDMLYYDTLVIWTEDLTVPHPEIANRRFTLVPLSDIAPDFIHPELEKNHRTLLGECDDPLTVKKFEA